MLAMREFVFCALKLLKITKSDSISDIISGDKCLNVIYNNYKIDIPLLGEWGDTQIVLIENHLEETRSVSFTSYFNRRANMDNFKKLVKIFKGISKMNGTPSLSGLSITVILQEVLSNLELNGRKIYGLFRYTLNRLIDRLSNSLYIYSPILRNTRSLDPPQRSKNFLKKIIEVKNNGYRISEIKLN
jgi:hypothetical protein